MPLSFVQASMFDLKKNRFSVARDLFIVRRFAGTFPDNRLHVNWTDL